MARSISPLSSHELPRSTYEFAEAARETCAMESSNNSNERIAIRRMRQVIRSRFMEKAQPGARADVAFFIIPPSRTKAIISAITRHAAEFFSEARSTQ